MTRADGDAYARMLVRAQEAAQALDLVEAALAAETAPRERGQAIEGPRGPLEATRGYHGWQFYARGADEARAVAAEAMIGLEWSSALLALASFDLSPWSVGS